MKLKWDAFGNFTPEEPVGGEDDLKVLLQLTKANLAANTLAQAVNRYFGWLERPGYDLRLMSVSDIEELINDSRSLVVVAFVNARLHVRIFDAGGQKVVDKAELELVAGQTLTDLKQRLTPLPDEVTLSHEDKHQIIDEATSIAGYPHVTRTLPFLRNAAQGLLLRDSILELYRLAQFHKAKDQDFLNTSEILSQIDENDSRLGQLQAQFEVHADDVERATDAMLGVVNSFSFFQEFNLLRWHAQLSIIFRYFRILSCSPSGRVYLISQLKRPSWGPENPPSIFHPVSTVSGS
jgi:hypothetical protein